MLGAPLPDHFPRLGTLCASLILPSHAADGYGTDCYPKYTTTNGVETSERADGKAERALSWLATQELRYHTPLRLSWNIPRKSTFFSTFVMILPWRAVDIEVRPLVGTRDASDRL
ncbi:hypothetical protein B0I37DRAFT_360409 [Chaetomium sp. MPI-CAGE-AT-0009]|nr:hypothetical protein B0I37DRAFT_360409 [Chaetomium sp. MPI-CAGE-AT-0009]